MEDNILMLFIMFALLLPYLALLYKKVNIRIRLLFASLFQLIIFYILFSITIKTKNLVLLKNGYSFELIFVTSLTINFLAIVITWIFGKWDRNFGSKN